MRYITVFFSVFAITSRLVCGTHAAELIATKDIKITVAEPPVIPEIGIPKDALRAGLKFDSDSNNELNLGFTIGTVLDRKNHGSLSNVVANRISAITVTYSDPALYTTTQVTEDFLRRLLTTHHGSTYTHVPWAQGLLQPNFETRISHTEGQSGRWLVWCGRREVFCAYQDGAGKWWFSYWMEVEGVRLKPKKMDIK